MLVDYGTEALHSVWRFLAYGEALLPLCKYSHVKVTRHGTLKYVVWVTESDKKKKGGRRILPPLTAMRKITIKNH